MNTAFVPTLCGYTAKTRLIQSTRASAFAGKRYAQPKNRVAGRTSSAVAVMATKAAQRASQNLPTPPGWWFASAAPVLAALSGLPTLANAGEDGSMTVQFGAYLAVFLGTLIPVAFLIILYIQSETRKAAMQAVSGNNEEEEELEFE
jgi:photosystem II reaction center protein PsbM